jgi:hypothetical protein
VSSGPNADLEIRLLRATSVKEDEPDTERAAQNVEARDVFLCRVGGHDYVGTVREQLVGASLAERDDESGRIVLVGI